jgi:hypothetical protein
MTTSKQTKVIEKLKSNLCIFVCKDQNYDYVDYQQQKEDNLDKLFTPKLQTKSRSRIPIYYKTPTISKKKDEDSIYNNNYDDVASEINETPYLHSTKIDNFIQSPSISKFPYLILSPEPSDSNIASSTLIYKILPKVQNNYYSPNVSEIPVIKSSPSSIGSRSSEDTSSSSLSDEMSIRNNDTFKIGAIYSCIRYYNAKYDGDLTVKFAERLQIIKDDGDDYILVKDLSTNAFGYVPRDHIIPVNTFLANLV